MSLGFTARQTIPIVFFGFMICSVVITLTGKIGATYHVCLQYFKNSDRILTSLIQIAYPVAVRSVFGMYGSYPAIAIRGTL